MTINQPPLNPDARRAAFEAVQAIDGPASIGSMEIVDVAVSAYLAVAQLESNSVEGVFTVAIKSTPKSGGPSFYEYPGCTPEIGTLSEAHETLAWVKEGWPERPDSPYNSEISIYKLTEVPDA